MITIQAGTYLTAVQAASILGIHRNSVSAACRSGRLSSVEIPYGEHDRRMFLILESDVQTYRVDALRRDNGSGVADGNSSD